MNMNDFSLKRKIAWITGASYGIGFAIAEDPWQAALVESLIIGTVTFGICFAGLEIGKRFGTRLAGKAAILGGVILIGIGIEIFVPGIR